MADKTIAKNRKARHDYHVMDSFEVGIVLQGTEVKSLREGHITLKDSYADIEGGEIFLVGAHINPYEQGNIYNHDPERRRKLLMHKREILKLAQQIAEKGYTLIPLKLYFKEGKVKVELGLCRGKQTYDKRQSLKAKEHARDMDRALKEVRRG